MRPSALARPEGKRIGVDPSANLSATSTTSEAGPQNAPPNTHTTTQVDLGIPLLFNRASAYQTTNRAEAQVAGNAEIGESRTPSGSHLANESRRKLITYAFVGGSLERTSNVLAGITPLFNPIANKHSGEIFEPTTFAAEVLNLYGIEINPLAVEGLLPHLVKAGILRRPERNKRTFTYSTEATNEDNYERFEEVLDDLLTRFNLYVSRLSSISKLNFTPEEIENILLDTVVNDQSNVGETAEEGSTTIDSSSMAYIAGRFILDLEKQNPELVDDLAQIRAAAMVSEVVLSLRQPPDRNRKYPNLHLFVDGPIVMGLLGLSGADRRDNLSKILTQIKTIKCSISLFTHSVEEIKNMIYAVLSAPAALRSGPFGDALRNGEILESQGREIEQNPQKFIKELGITIDSANSIRRPEYTALFDDSLRRLLESKMTNWPQPSRQRDALSVLFLTENARLSRIAHEFCVEEELIDQYHAGPAINVRRFAALLWVLLGGAEERKELSRRQLLANCAFAVRSRPDVIAKMIDTLRRVQPEMLGQIQVLMALPRSSRLAMDVSLGSAAQITAENIEEVVSSVRKATIVEETARFEELLAEREDRITLRDFKRRLEDMEAEAKEKIEMIDKISRTRSRKL